ncbi:MAG: alpha/beta fold hydrolase, partial [bacterium]
MTTARHIRWLCIFSIAAAVGLSCGTGATPPAPSEIALEDVREEVRQIIDPTRATPANGDFAGRPDRLLETRIWSAEEALARPACRGGYCGLILLAHGFGGNTGRFDAIGQRLAAAGYLVAAVQFPLTNDQAPGGYSTGGIDLQAQPQDLSAVLDALLAANRDPQDSLFQRIDEERIGAMGHSAGGTTLLANTRLSCCIDTRIRATAYVEPAATFVAALFGENYSARGPPTLTLQGEIDFPITPEASREFNASLEPPKILV